MPDIELRIEVESNTEALTAMAVHRLIKDLVDSSTESGEVLLFINTPKHTGTMSEHIERRDAEDLGEVIRGSFGIPPIFSEDERSSPDYPLFVDQGSGIFGTTGERIRPHTSNAMVFEARWPGKSEKEIREGIIIRASTKGQEGQHFALETYQEMVRLIIPQEIETFERRLKLLSE